MKQNKGFLIIGITGGAGSGKTTIVECIKKLLPVTFIHCDVIAHQLMEPGGPSYEALIQEYGRDILEKADGTVCPHINRAKLAKIALATQERAKRLNEITHPLVRKRVEEQLLQLEAEQFQGVAVIEAALLIEAGYKELCDELWYVQAPLADRIRRMQGNRGYSKEKTEQILAAQLSEEEFLAHADFVVQNPDSSEEEHETNLIHQIEPHLKEKLESIGMMCYNK